MQGHTPEQAGRLWCPMVRLAAATPNGQVVGGQAVFNRLQIGFGAGVAPDSAMCLADKCAMWRWNGPVTRYIDGTEGYPERGFCGLAGAVQVSA